MTSLTEPELKPCPCCGSRNVAFSTLWHYVIRCNDCGISTMMNTTRDEAISIWNRRPEPQPEAELKSDRREILEAKKEKYLRILIAELHSMKETLQHPFTIGAAVCNTSNVCQAACDLGEVVFELAQLEKGEKGKN